MSKEPLRVSDHAVLRYLERAMDFNIEIVRRHIASTCEGAAAVGAVCVRSEGLRFEIANGNTVTTVRPDRVAPGQTTRSRNQRIIERTERDRIEGRNGIDAPRPLFSPRARAGSGGGNNTRAAIIVRDASGDPHVFDPGIAGFPAVAFSNITSWKPDPDTGCVTIDDADLG